MKTIIILVAFFLPLISQAEWLNKKFNQTYLQGVTGSSEVVYICGNNSIFKSTDNANSWAELPTGLNSNERLYNIVFQNALIGCAVGKNGLVIKTINGGDSWIDISPDAVSRDFSGIVFLSDEEIVVTGTNGGIYTTVNGGTTWNDRSILSSSVLFEVVTSNNNLFSAGQQSDYSFIKSTDQGSNWSLSPIANFSGYGSAVSGEYIFLSGFNSSGKLKIVRSTNGETWTSNTMFEDGIFTDITFNNSEMGYALSNRGANFSSIYKTINAGDTWEKVAEFNHKLNDIFFNSTTVYAVGDSGNIFTSGVQVGISNYNSEVPSGYSLSQNYPNPFNPETNINFTIPQSGIVKLAIYDIAGKEISVLLNEELSAGSHSYDFQAGSLSTGTYFYKIETENFIETKKMMLIK